MQYAITKKIAEGNLPENEIPINNEYISAYVKKNITRESFIQR